MKNGLLILLIAVAVCSGCVTKYRVTLKNGSYYATYQKPKLDKTKNRYVFTDTSGTPHEFSPLAISEIAPEDMHERPKTEFTPTAPKQ